ncbi:DUF503 family protein [Caldibacillus thermolactis]|jgi:uncharacterized protein|uniref:DUF503 family protein n=1 Tax=Pallidibacillus thermolactis TaxID=251051 RepID=A0ABT2WBK0_9BACI|nr:DUF503 family protein [Pallidibacillus thermolactis]MCU9593050.1 DUF503 family protein [Pallidibacillus thermolactis]MCU9600716.1 DUF503 family protein [Pallidibacillus thermolactis subsp. kokeshiiformis]
MILAAEIECFIYDAQSLKEKRSVLKRVMARIRNQFNVSIAETDYQNVWQRTTIKIVTVASSKVIAEQEFQKTLTLIDSFPEIERTLTHIEWL